jgi:hypothetical protein
MMSLDASICIIFAFALHLFSKTASTNTTEAFLTGPRALRALGQRT